MKYSILLWVILVIIGLYGALVYSALFFGFFTVGIFLIFYDLKRQKESPPTLPSVSIASQTQTCQNCGMNLAAEATFCPRCGGKVSKE